MIQEHFLKVGMPKKINGCFKAILTPCNCAWGQQQIEKMCIKERNKICREGVSGCPLSSPQGVVKVEVSKQNEVNRRVK
jgi:hypothetical protein